MCFCMYSRAFTVTATSTVMTDINFILLQQKTTNCFKFDNWTAGHYSSDKWKKLMELKNIYFFSLGFSFSGSG